MDSLGDNVKKILLAGIGAVAVTAEKSGEILDDLVKKGELTVEQGKVLNEELKHNIKEKMRENVKVSVKASTPEEMIGLLDKMTPEQVEILKEKLKELEEIRASEAEEKEKQQTGGPGCGEIQDQDLRSCCQDAGEADRKKECQEA